MFSSLVIPCPFCHLQGPNSVRFSLSCCMLTSSLDCRNSPLPAPPSSHTCRSDLAHLYFCLSCIDFRLSSQPLTPQGRVPRPPPTPTSICFSTAPHPPLNQSAPALPRTPPFPFWDLTPFLARVSALLFLVSSKGRAAPSNFSSSL